MRNFHISGSVNRSTKKCERKAVSSIEGTVLFLHMTSLFNQTALWYSATTEVGEKDA